MQISHGRPARTPRLSHALLAALVAGLAACGGGDGDSGSGTSSSSQADDIRTAQQFFGNLRDNARTLQKGPTETGIADGVKAFGQVVQVEAASLATAAADSIALDRMAFELWDDYKNGRRASNSLSDGPLAGCTVFQGAFPASLGPLPSGSVPASEFQSSSVPAANPAAATWVACSKDNTQLTGTPRFRQTKLYDMAGAVAAGRYPGSVDYLAVTRSQRRDSSVVPAVVWLRNLTPVFRGSVGVTPSAVAGLLNTRLQGDLPPLTDAGGTLLAGHYAADLQGSVSQHSSGAEEIRFAAGRFASVPLASSGAQPLTIDLAAGGAAGPSVVVWPIDKTNAAQRQAAQVSLHAVITHDTGRLDGVLSADRIDLDTGNNELFPHHVKFTGDAAVRPQGGTALVSFLQGTLEATETASPAVVRFDGKMTLPGRPEATLTVSVNETSSTTESFSGSYTQNGLRVDFDGTRAPNVTTATLSSSTGVKTIVLSNRSTADVTVEGRHVGVIRRDTSSIVYDDGHTESLL